MREQEETANIPLIVDILRPNGTVRCTDVELVVSRYVTNGNIAISATCTDTSMTLSEDGVYTSYCEPGEPWGVLTVNPDVTYGDDTICVKDYSEGAGNLMTLESAGIIKGVCGTIDNGFVEIPVCKLTPKGKAFVTASLKARRPDDGEGLA